MKTSNKKYKDLIIRVHYANGLKETIFLLHEASKLIKN